MGLGLGLANLDAAAAEGARGPKPVAACKLQLGQLWAPVASRRHRRVAQLEAIRVVERVEIGRSHLGVRVRVRAGFRVRC